MTHASLEFCAKPALEYPYKRGWAPEPGQPFELADGVFWLHVPMPIDLDHINLWILRDGDGWILVDSGYDAPQCREVWETVFDGFLQPQDVKKIIITHLHPDHTGLASWLAHRCGCAIHISQGELDVYQRIFVEKNPDKLSLVKRYLVEVGFDESRFESIMMFFSAEEKPAEMRIQRSMCEVLADNDEVIINNRVWRVVVGNGHSPEHACLYCAELELMISGDQALPRISSNVSVYPENIDSNPLKDWLNSCAKLQKLIPDNTLILPSHQEPFFGLHARMEQLMFDHHAQLNQLRSALQTPSTTVEMYPVLFPRELNHVQIVFATGETLAHINYLLDTGEIVKSHRDDGALIYQLSKVEIAS